MLPTVLEQCLLSAYEREYGHWSRFRRLGDEVSQHCLWLTWLALDIEAMALVEHIRAEGEVEAPGRLARLDCDGRLVVFYDSRVEPIRHPRRFDFPAFPLPRREALNAA